MPFVVINRAEDGTYESKFNTFEEANAYLEELSGTTLQSYWDYAYGDFVTLDRFKRAVTCGSPKTLVDDWGRQITIEFRPGLESVPFIQTPNFSFDVFPLSD